MARPPVRDERRAQILDAMYEVIAKNGAANASISDIADAAGVARGALHYFFASKDEITVALMRRLGERYLEQLGASLDRRIAKASDDSLRTKLVGDLARWHFMGEAHDVERRLTVWIDFWGQAASHPEIRTAIVEIQEGARGLFKRALLAQRPELSALDDDALRAHTAALLALVEGTLLQWRFTSTKFDRGQMGDVAAKAATAIAMGIQLPNQFQGAITNPRLRAIPSQAA